MPRAAPGESISRAMRRKFAENMVVPGRVTDRCRSKIRPRSEVVNCHDSKVAGLIKGSYFTQQLSGFGVGRGRLGEVVSLVGDCRPPPPGNPHRPTKETTPRRWVCEKSVGGKFGRPGDRFFTPPNNQIGGDFFHISKHCSFNRNTHTANLKDLDLTEYFKNNRSYYSCGLNHRMLEFGSFHYHICGLLEAEPPSIVMTNVLGIMV